MSHFIVNMSCNSISIEGKVSSTGNAKSSAVRRSSCIGKVRPSIVLDTDKPFDEVKEMRLIMNYMCFEINWNTFIFV